jgi:hypothetical protein
MKILLAANSLFTFLIALVMILFPSFFLGEPSGEPTAMALTNATARHYGFAALALGGLSLLMMMRKITPEVKFSGLGAITLFHLGLTVSQVINVIKGISPIPLVIVHGAFFLIFFATFVWGTKKED